MTNPIAKAYLKYMTKLFDWIGSWYSEKIAWIFCIGYCSITFLFWLFNI